MLVWVDGDRTIREHIAVADVSDYPTVILQTYQPLPVTAVGDAVTLIAGDQKTVAVCRDRFANVNHFGGFPRLPERNPLIQGVS